MRRPKSKTRRTARQLAVTTAILLALCTGLTTPAEAGIEFEARVWAPTLTGSGLIGEQTDGRVIDLEDDLGLEADEFLEGRFTWKPLKALMFRIAYTPMTFSGDAQIEEEFEFGGEIFPVRIQVLTDLKIDYGRFAAAWMFPLGSDDFRLGPIVEAKGFYGDASLVGRLVIVDVISASEDFAAGFGSAGLIMDYKPIPTLHLFAEGTVDVGVTDGAATDVELGIKFFPLKLFSISGGYRYIKIEYQDDPDFAEIELSGFFLGASVRF